MAKILKEIPMGNFVVTLRQLANGDLQAKLTSASHGPLIEIEKLENGNLKIRELEFGSAKITIEHLSILLTLIGTADEMKSELDRIQNLMHHHD